MITPTFTLASFMVGLGKPKLFTKFEIPSFSHCVHIEMEPQHFGELPWPKAMPTFPMV